MDENNFTELLQKYNLGQCSPEEIALVETWYLNQQEQPLNASMEDLSSDLDQIEVNLKAHVASRRVFPWHRLAAAASVLFFLAVGSYFILHERAVPELVKLQKHDVAPAVSRATLTLANGHKIPLLKSLTGKLAQQGNVAINVTAGANLTYTSGKTIQQSNIAYNMLSTVRGEQSPFTLVLADGTKVWLNAASSITYPIAFNGKERSVTVTGEAYFEVVHDALKPFRVKYKDQVLEDIGTHFNINAYDDEPVVKTTLLEGAVSITKNNHKLVLKPGQQAISNANSGELKIDEGNTEEAVAWKNGYFFFDNESLESVMRKISRWYNVDVEYPEGKKIIANYWGSMSRTTNILVVLKKLQATNNVHFKIDGNKVLVFKK